MDHKAYGEALEVPRFDPRSGAGSAHVWYVVEDVDLLHRLLQMGVSRWGQLRALLESGDRSVLQTDRETSQRVEASGRALEAFVRAWSVGRGKPVHRMVLQDSGAVSETFIDEVSQLAQDLSGDGEKIVEALIRGDVARFRTGKAEDLRAYLEDERYIDPADPLPETEVSRRIVASLVRTDVPAEQARNITNTLLARLSGDA
jgi:hypothetical protein